MTDAETWAQMSAGEPVVDVVALANLRSVLAARHREHRTEIRTDPPQRTRTARFESPCARISLGGFWMNRRRDSTRNSGNCHCLLTTPLQYPESGRPDPRR